VIDQKVKKIWGKTKRQREVRKNEEEGEICLLGKGVEPEKNGTSKKKGDL